MIELTVSFAIHIGRIKHYLIVTHLYRIALMTAAEWHHKLYCSKNRYLNLDDLNVSASVRAPEHTTCYPQ